MEIARRLVRLEAAALEREIEHRAGILAEHEAFSAEELVRESMRIVCDGLTPVDIAAELGCTPAELLAEAQAFRDWQ